jgi:DNA-binding response OmpR family regulator
MRLRLVIVYALLMRILVVEDDSLVRDAVRRGLSAAGFTVDHVGTAEAADAALLANHFDVAVVDIGLPGDDGLQLVRRIRRRGQTLPVLILTARDALADRVTALDLGADDYMAKPFEVAEVAARCRALIRRASAVASSRLKIGTMDLDLNHKQAYIDGQELGLTRREWLVLECLALDSGRLVSKSRLLSAIASWDEDISENAVEVYVSRLRTKLGDAATIRVVRGLGYRLDEPTGK